MFGKTEQLILVLIIILLLFGAKKLPELARGAGNAMKELRKGFTDDADDGKEVSKSKSNGKK